MGSMINWTISRLQTELAGKTIATSDIIRQSLGREKELKKLNAFVTVTPKFAEKQITVINHRRSKGETRPLDGVPLAVKDNFTIRGVRTTCGSLMLSDFVPTYTATVVKRLFASGAVLIGKTNLDEFGMGSGCIDSCHGKTFNAWNPNCVAGGSSGGSAIAVATGITVAALGSDTGGSTRNPAAYNGIVGLKPSYGRLSRYGLIPLVNSMDVPGILTRSIDDAALILNCTSGWDELDSTTVSDELRPVSISANPSVKGLSIGIPKEYLTEHISCEVRSAWEEVANILIDGGATLKEISLPHTKHSIACYSVLNQCEVASNMARYDGLEFGLRGDNNDSTEQMYAQSRALGLGDVVRRRVLCGNYFLLAKNYDRYFLKALKIRRLIAEDFANVWRSGINAILTPVTLSDAPDLGDFLKKDERTQSAYQDYCTQPANMAGIPAVALPVGLSKRGLPLSMQFMAPNFNEDSLLNIAKFVENIINFEQHRLNKCQLAKCIGS